MNTITEKKLVGGMISSIGFQQQDYASITYMFKYLGKELKEISFESADDFCIVLEKTKIFVQVKTNLLTVSFVRKLLKNASIENHQVFIGSGFDDEFRNILQYKERYINSINGQTYKDKDKLNSDWEEICSKKGLNYSLLLKCDFDSIDSKNQISITRDSIAQWAEDNNIYVDTRSLLTHLLSVVSMKRSHSGQLSKNDIETLISQYRSPFRLTSYNNAPMLRSIINELEHLIKNNRRFSNDLLVIKNDIENNNLTGAKNRIENCYKDNILRTELQRTYLWILNQLEEYSAVIAKEQNFFCKDTHYEISFAYFKLHDLDHSAKCLDYFSKDQWTEDDYILRAYIYMLNMDEKSALHELEQCLNINHSNVDALIAIGFIYISLDQNKATRYFIDAASLCTQCAEAYWGLAIISERAYDFETALQYYHKFEKAAQYELPSVLLAKMGAYSHILKKSDASIYFQKWNAAFRNENTIVGEKAVLLVVNDIENSYIFSLLSKKTGVRVSLFDSIIYDENILYNGISSIGTIPDWFNYQSNMFLGHYSPNPLKNDDRIIIKESLIPVIKRTYGNYEAFQNVCSQIIKNDKVHLNHILSATERDYQVDDDTIDVELILNGKQLTGAVTIGLVKMPIWINPVGEGFEAFRKELSTDKNFNEAIFILSYNNYESTFYFNKSLIKIRYC